MTLNANFPATKVLVRKEFLYNLEKGFGEYVKGWVFGISSLRGRAIGFHVLLESGAVFWRLPIHALHHKENAPSLDLSVLQCWDALSYDVVVNQFDFLRDLDCKVMLRNKTTAMGIYVATIDFCGAGTLAETPDEHKCAHFIKLENGCFTLQPNNRVLWSDASLTKAGDIPDYKINTHFFYSEDGNKWVTQPEQFFYGIESNSTKVEKSS